MSLPYGLRMYCLCAVVIAGSFGALSCGEDCVQTPSISSIAPNSAPTGSPGLDVVVEGNHFQRNSTILWNGVARTTTFVSGHELHAFIPSEDLVAPGTSQITAFSPSPSQEVTFGNSAPTPISSTAASMQADCVGGTSKALPFTIAP